jgi:hypothetical protein
MRGRTWAVVATAALVTALSGCAAGTWFEPSHPTIDVSVSQPCPETLGSAKDVVDRSDGSRSLLPAGRKPASARACSYERRRLVLERSFDARAARQLSAVVNRIDLSRPIGNFNCPAVFDSAVIIAFRYGSTVDVDLWWSDSGCQTLDNGRLGGFQGANGTFGSFQNTYAQLVREPASR